MRVHGLVFRSVLQTDVVAVTGAHTREHHNAVGGGSHGCTPGCTKVRSLVRAHDACDRMAPQRRKFRAYALDVKWYAHKDALGDMAPGVIVVSALTVVTKPEKFSGFAFVIKRHRKELAVAHEIALCVLRFVDEAPGVAGHEFRDNVAVKVKRIVHLTDNILGNAGAGEARLGIILYAAACEVLLHFVAERLDFGREFAGRIARNI